MKRNLVVGLVCLLLIAILTLAAIGCGNVSKTRASKQDTAVSKSEQESSVAQETSPPPLPNPEITLVGSSDWGGNGELRYQFTNVYRTSTMSSDMGTGQGDWIVIKATVYNDTNQQVSIPPIGIDNIYLKNKITGEKYAYWDISSPINDFYSSQGLYTENRISVVLGGDSKSGYIMCNLSPGSIRQNSNVSSPKDLILVFSTMHVGPEEEVKAQVDLGQITPDQD